MQNLHPEFLPNPRVIWYLILQQACDGKLHFILACPCTGKHLSIRGLHEELVVGVLLQPEHILEAHTQWWLVGCSTIHFNHQKHTSMRLQRKLHKWHLEGTFWRSTIVSVSSCQTKTNTHQIGVIVHLTLGVWITECQTITCIMNPSDSCHY